MPCQVQVENRRKSRGTLRRASLSLLAFTLILCFAVAKRCSGAVASPHFVQAVAAAGMGKGLSVSFTRNTVAGDIILVGVDFTMEATPLLVTDSQGNTFNRVGSLLTSPGGSRSGVYYAKNVKGGAERITVNLSANSSYIEVYLSEYSGADHTNPIDAQVGESGRAGAVSSGNAKTTIAGDMIYGYCVGDWSCTSGSGFTALSTFHANLIEDKIAGSSGAYAATGSATNGWTMQMVALKPAPVAPVVAPNGPGVSLSSTSLTFAGEAVGIASPVQTVVVTSTGTTALTITSIVLKGTNAAAFTEVNTCSRPMAPKGNCVIAMLFKPLATGAATASLSVADNASGSPQTVSLFGSGIHDVTVSWTGSPNALVAGYNIYRGTTPGGEAPTPLNSTPIYATTYIDTNVKAGATYYYSVTAVASNGKTQSAHSKEAAAKVPSP
jgi:hypothetical protein